MAPTRSPGGRAPSIPWVPSDDRSSMSPSPSPMGPESKNPVAKVQVPREVPNAGMVEYAPGVCNIGPRGRIERAAFGVATIAFSIRLWHLARLNTTWAPATLPSWPILILFLPLAGGFLAVFEAFLGFCVLFAREG